MSRKKPQIKSIDLKLIQKRLFCRCALDDDWVIHLAEVIEQKICLPPIMVCCRKEGDYDLIDGRHRIEAYQLMNYKTVDCEIYPYMTDSEILAKGICCNWGSGLATDQRDLTRVIEHMILNGSSRKDIFELLTNIGPMVPKHYGIAWQRIKRVKIRTAIELIDGGMSNSKAAEQCGLCYGDVESAIHRRNNKKGVGATKLGLLKINITKIQQSWTANANTQWKRIADQYEQMVLTSSDILKLLDHLDRSVKNINRFAINTKARWHNEIMKSKKVTAA